MFPPNRSESRSSVTDRAASNFSSRRVPIPRSPDTSRDAGAGIHHICFRVTDLDAALTNGRSGRGSRHVPPRIRTGSGGQRVAFLHPRTAGGVLIELSEPADVG